MAKNAEELLSRDNAGFFVTQAKVYMKLFHPAPPDVDMLTKNTFPDDEKYEIWRNQPEDQRAGIAHTVTEIMGLDAGEREKVLAWG